MLTHWEKLWTWKADPPSPPPPPPPKKKKKKNFRYSCEDSFTYTEKFASFRSSKQKKKTQFGLTKAKVFFNVSISKGKYSTFLFNSLRFKIILHPLTFLGHTKIGDMYSLFEWWAFLITPFFNNSDTSKSIACICSVEHLWLCAGFSCTGSSAKSISPWARYRNPPPPPPPLGDTDFWIAQYVSFQYLLVCKMNYSAFRDYLRWYIAA